MKIGVHKKRRAKARPSLTMKNYGKNYGKNHGKTTYENSI
jgi:hypothetical protein